MRAWRVECRGARCPGSTSQNRIPRLSPPIPNLSRSFHSASQNFRRHQPSQFAGADFQWTVEADGRNASLGKADQPLVRPRSTCRPNARRRASAPPRRSAMFRWPAARSNALVPRGRCPAAAHRAGQSPAWRVFRRPRISAVCTQRSSGLVAITSGVMPLSPASPQAWQSVSRRIGQRSQAIVGPLRIAASTGPGVTDHVEVHGSLGNGGLEFRNVLLYLRQASRFRLTEPPRPVY